MDCHFPVLATEGGAIYVWTIPEGGLTEVIEEPTLRIPAHPDKIYSILVCVVIFAP